MKLNKIESMKIDVDGISVVPYIKSDDVAYIGKQIMTRIDYMERKILKEMLILEKCTNIKDLDKYDYDELKANGVIDAVLCEIKNVDCVDEYVKFTESMNMAVNEFLKQTLVQIDKFGKKIPTGKKLEDMLEKISKQVNK